MKRISVEKKAFLWEYLVKERLEKYLETKALISEMAQDLISGDSRHPSILGVAPEEMQRKGF